MNSKTGLSSLYPNNLISLLSSQAKFLAELHTLGLIRGELAAPTVGGSCEEHPGRAFAGIRMRRWVCEIQYDPNVSPAAASLKTEL